MTDKERLSSLHERVEALQRKRERRKTAAIGAAGVILGVCLFILIFTEGSVHYGYTPGPYSGSMLFENAGGYVLVAILSFAAAVVITILCIRWKKKQNEKTDPDTGKIREEDTHEN